MLETRIKFTGTLEHDLREYIDYQYSNERGALNFTIKQALVRFLESELEKIREKKKKEMINKLPEKLGEAIAQGIIANQKEKEEQK